jgi:hypothetical protein
MVAEGPAVKMFSRMQWVMIENDLEIFSKVLDAAVAAGRLDKALRDAVEITAEPPRLEARNRMEEVNADTTLVRERIMSRHTAQLRHDLDPEKEDSWIDEDREKNDPFADMNVNPFAAKDDGDRGDDDKQDDGKEAKDNAKDGKSV